MITRSDAVLIYAFEFIHYDWCDVVDIPDCCLNRRWVSFYIRYLVIWCCHYKYEWATSRGLFLWNISSNYGPNKSTPRVLISIESKIKGRRPRGRAQWSLMYPFSGQSGLFSMLSYLEAINIMWWLDSLVTVFVPFFHACHTVWSK